MNLGSPEILKGMSYRAAPAEMWSLAVRFMILTGEIPFPILILVRQGGAALGIKWKERLLENA